MSSLASDKSLREKTRCSICLEVMMKPMSIMCGHSYCHSCIVGMFEKTQDETSPSLETFYCPQCQAPFQKESIRPNKHLQSIIETIKYLNNKWSCEEHNEKLQLFCEDDGQLICWRCERAPQHKGHNAVLVKKACTDYEEKLNDIVEKLKKKDILYNEIYVRTEEQITEWKENIEKQRQKIQCDFQNFHHFLFEEQKSYLLKLEMEKEETLRKLQDNKSKLEKLRHELQEYIQIIEWKCKGSTLDLLQNVKEILMILSTMKPDLPDDVSLEVQTVCDISKLHFDANKYYKVDY